MNGAAVNCFVCARLCSFDPSGPCGKLQLNGRMPKTGRARRGGRKGWRQGEGKRERAGLAKEETSACTAAMQE